ncbi:MULTISPECIES: MFS transporter [unclassified Marinomonas]|uniref:MFS transporter n=1 Tax=unclassified Marinomonas TaxID=196814 RepID=UPI0007AF9045|nr:MULTISPECIES: MFS transporter [unclassified Marinomonas]
MTTHPIDSRWQVLLFLLIANFLNLLDITIVHVATPSIAKDLAIPYEQTQWISIVYLIAFAAGLLPFGKLGDMKGRKKLFNLGLISFLIASMMCALAVNLESLLIARFIQGISAAVMLPQVLAIANLIFPQAEKNRMFSIVGIISSLASILGPLLGGILLTIDLFSLDWRSIFIINIPLGLIAFWGVNRHLNLTETLLDNEVIDWVGIGLYTSACICIILPLVEGYQAAWPAWLISLLLASLLFITLFIYWLRQCEKKNRSSLFPARLYLNKRFIRNLTILMLFSSAVPGLFYVLAIFLQSHLTYSPFEAGFITFPFPLGVMLASMYLKKLNSKWNDLRISMGALLLCLALFSIGLLSSRLYQLGNMAYIMIPLFVAGLGMGSAIIALFQQSMMIVESTDSGTASGAMQSLQHIAMAIGIGIVGQIFFINLNITPNAVLALKYCMFYASFIFFVLLLYLLGKKLFALEQQNLSA